jgi:hypothetical protein
VPEIWFPYNLDWFTSSFSVGDGECVEAGLVPGGIFIRDKKDRAGPVLSFTASQWKVFLIAVRQDAQDLGAGRDS